MIYFWLILGIVLFILEIFTFIPGFFLASFGLSAFLTAIAAFLHLGLKVQIFVFAISAFIICMFILPRFRKHLHNPKNERKTGVDGYIDRTATVIQKIQNSKNTGRIKIYGEEWKALSANDEDIEENEIVKIKKMQDLTMFVEKI